MKEQTAVRRGIPLNKLVSRILTPAAVVLSAGAVVLSFVVYRQLEKSALQDIISTVNTVYETHPAIQGQSNGLAVLRRTRGFERFWILSATGDVLASSRTQDVGSRLDRAWWKYLEGRPGGTISERIPFGSQTLLMVGVYHPEQGRWAVLVTEPPDSTMSVALSAVLILLLSLILVGATGLSAWHSLRRSIEKPVEFLDDTTSDLLRGISVSNATLDRVRAEVEPALGGHADTVLDLCRKYSVMVRKSGEAEERFERLFDALDGLAFIRSSDARILGINAAMQSRVGLSREWTLGNTVQILRNLVPIRILEQWLSKPAAKKIAIRNVEIYPAQAPGLQCPVTLSALPMRFQGDAAHLIIVQELVPDDKAVDESFLESEVQDVEDSGSDSSVPQGNLIAQNATTGDGASLDMEPSRNSDFEPPLRAVLDESDDMVAILNESTDVIFWNARASNLTGWKETDIKSLRLFGETLLDEGGRSRFQTWLTGTPTENTLRLPIRTRNNKLLDTRWRARDITGTDGSTYGVLTGRVVRGGATSRKRNAISKVSTGSDESRSGSSAAEA